MGRLIDEVKSAHPVSQLDLKKTKLLIRNQRSKPWVLPPRAEQSVDEVHPGDGSQAPGGAVNAQVKDQNDDSNILVKEDDRSQKMVNDPVKFERFRRKNELAKKKAKATSKSNIVKMLNMGETPT